MRIDIRFAYPGVGLLRLCAGLQQLFDFSFGEGFNRSALETRRGDFLHGIGNGKLAARPFEKGGECDPDIENVFGGEGMGLAIDRKTTQKPQAFRPAVRIE